MSINGAARRWGSSLLVSGKLCVSLGQSLSSLPAGCEHVERNSLHQLGPRHPGKAILDRTASAKARTKGAPREYTKPQGVTRVSPLDVEFCYTGVLSTPCEVDTQLSLIVNIKAECSAAALPR